MSVDSFASVGVCLELGLGPYAQTLSSGQGKKPSVTILTLLMATGIGTSGKTLNSFDSVDSLASIRSSCLCPGLMSVTRRDVTLVDNP
jgi:hypothetical protein